MITSGSDAWKRRAAAGVCYLCEDVAVPGLRVRGRPICRRHLLARREKLCSQAGTCSHLACAADGGSCVYEAELDSWLSQVEEYDSFSPSAY